MIDKNTINYFIHSQNTKVYFIVFRFNQTCDVIYDTKIWEGHRNPAHFYGGICENLCNFGPLIVNEA